MRSLTVVLSPRERDLIMKYAYPFEAILRQCTELQASSKDEPVVDDSYWWEQILGNLAITLNEDVPPGSLADELHELYERVEEVFEG